MAAGKLTYANSANFTLTLASLAQAAARESTAIDNGTNAYINALVRVQVKLQTGTPASDLTVYVYAYGSEDGTNYTDNATGSDAAITLRTPPAARLLGTIPTPDSGALTYKSNPFPVARAFGGVMPRKWGIIVLNRTNIAFDTTEGNHAYSYTGVGISIA
jgi:hypothetical protein